MESFRNLKVWQKSMDLVEKYMGLRKLFQKRNTMHSLISFAVLQFRFLPI